MVYQEFNSERYREAKIKNEIFKLSSKDHKDVTVFKPHNTPISL